MRAIQVGLALGAQLGRHGATRFDRGDAVQDGRAVGRVPEQARMRARRGGLPYRRELVGR
jgi:hypothetical protein